MHHLDAEQQLNHEQLRRCNTCLHSQSGRPLFSWTWASGLTVFLSTGSALAATYQYRAMSGTQDSRPALRDLSLCSCVAAQPLQRYLGGVVLENKAWPWHPKSCIPYRGCLSQLQGHSTGGSSIRPACRRSRSTAGAAWCWNGQHSFEISPNRSS